MSLRVTCICGKAFNAPESLAGKRVKCPVCGSALAIPAAPANVDSLIPLDSSAPPFDDPLGLGDFDERSMATSARPLAARPATGRPAAARSGVDANTLKIAWTVGACAAVVIIVVVAFVLIGPELKNATEPAAQATAEIAPDAGLLKGMNRQNVDPSTHSGVVSRGSDPSQWITYESEEFGYSVMLPYEPAIRDESKQGSLVKLAICEQSHPAFAVVVRRPPAEVATSPHFRVVDAMDAIIDLEIKQVAGQLESRKSLIVDGRSARDVVFTHTQDGRQLRTTARHIAVDRTIYSLLCISVSEPGPEAQQFFDSFKPPFIVGKGS